MKNRTAFTLVEMLASLTILSIIMLSAGAVMTLAARAFSNSTNTNNPSVQAALARSAVDQIADDMKMANSFPTTGPTSVTFTVPDRTGDGADETISYSWAGAGQPLVRTFNGVPTTMASNVQNFNLSYITKALGPPPSPPTGTSSEQLLFSSPSPSGVRDFTTTSTTWSATYFQPTLPANTITWAITRIKLQVRRNGTHTGTLKVPVKVADASFHPTGIALDTGSIDVSKLTSATGGGWIDVPFSNLSGLSPSAALTVSVTWNGAGTIAYPEYDDNSNPPVTMNWSQTTNAGLTWTTNTKNTFQIYVYGTVTTPAGP
jgi:prepilin-type N-terminal cleavage/methylation domain-containing protein